MRARLALLLAGGLAIGCSGDDPTVIELRLTQGLEPPAGPIQVFREPESGERFDRRVDAAIADACQQADVIRLTTTFDGVTETRDVSC